MSHGTWGRKWGIHFLTHLSLLSKLLQDAFDDLMAEFKKVGIKNSLLKKMISTLFKENEDLQKKNKDLKNKVYILKEKVKGNSSSKDSSKKKKI